jgi:membrane-associated phospholipid phosphatase
MKKRWERLSFSIIFLIAALALDYISNITLYHFYPNLVISTDFLFDHTPFINILWFADVILILAIISFLFFMFSKKKAKNFPFYAVVIGIYNIIRAVLLYLTPGGNPNPGSGLGLSFLPSGAVFPSGHVGTIFLFFLFTLNNKSKKWSIYFIVLVILEIASMILSRGHYTIDLVGALFIAFVIWKVMDEHFKDKLTLK